MAGFMQRLWSRVARSGSSGDIETVGSELIGDVRNWTLSNAGISVTTMSAMQHTAVMACVSILAEDVAKIPLRLYRRAPNGAKVEVFSTLAPW